MTLGVATIGVILITVAVATLAGPSAEMIGADALAARRPRDVPDRIDGHAVQTRFGRQLFLQNCSTCHGVGATGMPQQGANLRDSTFIARRSDSQLVSFLRVGRLPGERESVLRLTMPPRGGNPNLEDAELADIVGYLRLVQQERRRKQPQPQAPSNQTPAAATLGAAIPLSSHR